MFYELDPPSPSAAGAHARDGGRPLLLLGRRLLPRVSRGRADGIGGAGGGESIGKELAGAAAAEVERKPEPWAPGQPPIPCAWAGGWAGGRSQFEEDSQ